MTDQKSVLRAQMRAVRESIDAEDRKKHEDALCERLYNLPALRKAHVIAVYQACGSEASLNDLVRAIRLDGGTTIAYPAIHGGGDMSMVRVERGEVPSFVANPLAVTNPGTLGGDVVYADEIDVLLIPGVAFDENRNRLGQGGGYYDRYLEFVGEDCLVIGIAFDEQIVDSVPVNEQDRKVDYIVTPSRIIS